MARTPGRSDTPRNEPLPFKNFKSDGPAALSNRQERCALRGATQGGRAGGSARRLLRGSSPTSPPCSCRVPLLPSCLGLRLQSVLTTRARGRARARYSTREVARSLSALPYRISIAVYFKPALGLVLPRRDIYNT